MEIKEIQKLAKEYGVSLTEKIRFNEMGVTLESVLLQTQTERNG